MDNHYTPFSPSSSPTQRLLLKYDASAVLSEHLMSKSAAFVEIYNRAAQEGGGGRVRRRRVMLFTQ